ncbi:MAG: DUF202 domain-containing protein [Candidatus Coatesbacteria bacterium]|nr:DUF202 domain-containing protein [Candidatus Coatesbacteria bacterium]
MLRDKLAHYRTRLASERNLLAYIRTALAFLVTALACLRLFNDVVLFVFGWNFVGISIIVLIIGFVRFHKVKAHLKTMEENK